MTLRFGKCFSGLTTIGIASALLVSVADGQIFRGRNADRGNAAPAATAPGNTPADTRIQGRENVAMFRRGTAVRRHRSSSENHRSRNAAGNPPEYSSRRAADYGLWLNPANNGLVVSNVANNSVFANAGLRYGDQLVSLNGQPITTEQQFVQYLTGPNVGTQPIRLIALRNGQQVPLTVQPTAHTQGIVNHDPFYNYGFVLDDRNPNQYLVQRVYPRTPAYYAGLQPGDLITGYGGQPITSMNAFTQGLINANGPIPLQVTPSGQVQNLQLDGSTAAAQTAMRTNLNADTRLDGNTTINTPAASANINTPSANINATAPSANINTTGPNPNLNTTTPSAQPQATAPQAGLTVGPRRTSELLRPGAPARVLRPARI